MEWRSVFKESVLNSAKDYINSGAVRLDSITNNKLIATVSGIEDFSVELCLSGDEITGIKCNCPYGKIGSKCKHMAATLMFFEDYQKKHPAESVATSAPKSVTPGPKQKKEASAPSVPKPAVTPASTPRAVVAPTPVVASAPTSPEVVSQVTSVPGVELTCDIDDVMTYALVHNGAQIIENVIIKNHTEETLQGLTLCVITSHNLADKYALQLSALKPEDTVSLKEIDLTFNADYLVSLTERTICKVTVGLYDGDVCIKEVSKNITTLAFDQWPGLQYTPELLTSFAMPNHPVVISLMQLTSEFLKKWHADPSLEGYQAHDPNRVKQLAGAAYAAIQKKNINYANPPSSFEEIGQRVRLPDAVLDQHMGTCLDMTLLYVSLLEAIGLNPFMVMLRGHIFAGVWLKDDSFTEMIMDNPIQLEKRMSKGIQELLVVECTAMCAGRTVDFEKAIQMAIREVGNYAAFHFVLDVRRARSMGIRPLPVRLKTTTGFEVSHEDRKAEEISKAPKESVSQIDLSSLQEPEAVTKVTQWERKLLDLSLRNQLINMRMTQSVVPLLSAGVDVLEDALSDGEEFQVLPRPAELKISGDGTLTVEDLSDLGPFTDYMALESKHKRLHSLYTEGELGRTLTKLYRSAKTSMEENGASTLYLTLGLLRWFEGKSSDVPRYAPIVLVPVDIIRKSASKGYTLRMRDEDAQLNITLLEFLKQTFDLQIRGLNPPPEDEHGLDIPKIFAYFRHAIMDLARWDIVEVGFIGNFSFSQFVMWNDIHQKNGFLENNKIVRGLINGAIDWDCSIPEKVNTDEAYLPVAVDASQLRAVNMAAEGVSFVLHGPPGTGKSQTITALIANALTKGKTILFVAEKVAALEVVQRRLTALGIDDFCLELHSNKATKKAVLDQLNRSLELTPELRQTDYEAQIQEIRTMRASLDSYVKALHGPQPFGKSLWQIINAYESVPEHGKEIPIDATLVEKTTSNDLVHLIWNLEQLFAAGKEIGNPHEHPLSRVRQTEYSQSLKFDLNPIVGNWKTALLQLQQTVISFTALLGVSCPVMEKEWQRAIQTANGLLAIEKVPAFLQKKPKLENEFALPLAYLDQKEKLAAKEQEYKELWNENFLRSDMRTYQNKLEQANKKLLGKGRAIDALLEELQAFASFPLEEAKIPVYLTDIQFYQKDHEELDSLENTLSADWKNLLSVYDTKEKMKSYQDAVVKDLQQASQYSDLLQKLEAGGQLSTGLQQAKNVSAAFATLKDAEGKAYLLLKPDFSDMDENWMEERLNLCDSLLSHGASMKEWVVYSAMADKCRQKGLGSVCDAYEAGLEPSALEDVFLKSFYKALILEIIKKNPALNGFTGSQFNERIAQFKALDDDFTKLTKKEIYVQLTRRLPTDANSSIQERKELSILRKAIKSNGRGMSIRSLFEQIPTILPKLCPCMLMSPISVAQYLEAKNNLVDLVVFDEASQMPTCKAVGVLARGKNAVVVGDPNQMPPTSFFAGNKIDEDNLDIEDLDSILDDCLALGMPESRLDWHYRSRHESLIAFSNKEFYESSMYTFPSVNDRERKVSLVKVDGYFERGKNRINRGEAEAVVNEIKRRYKNPELSDQTIGVVTFNISQQTLVEDMLQKEFLKDAKFDSWANTGEEPLFVKNLENVQGDERDVILFSVAYGSDADGKLLLNFGPLNKNGGWKRLNVAVTRARQEMIVYTIMSPDMIDLKRTKAKGIEALKDFLTFAQRGSLDDSASDTAKAQGQGILKDICQVLESADYEYQIAVGHSKFKVDIAVVNPYNKNEFLLGILLDGPSYCQSTNTKDREVGQPGVLSSLGWTLHRIWTMDWWDNREKEIGKLLQLLETEKELASQKAEKIAVSVPEVEKTEESSPEHPQMLEQESTPDVTPVAEVEDGLPVRISAAVEDWAEEKAESDLDEKGIDSFFVPINPAGQVAVASAAMESTKEESQGITPLSYAFVTYTEAVLEETPLATDEYVQKDAIPLIAGKMQQIVDAEAPIEYERLIRKTLRAFAIGRSSAQTLEASDKAFKKVQAKTNKQLGLKFVWQKDQLPEEYFVFRTEDTVKERRSVDEISQQELKNAICLTLKQHGPLEKEALIKATIRTMGFARTGAALMAAVDRGLKYGRKTGEVILNAEKRLQLPNMEDS